MEPSPPPNILWPMYELYSTQFVIYEVERLEIGVYNLLSMKVKTKSKLIGRENFGINEQLKGLIAVVALGIYFKKVIKKLKVNKI